MEYLFVLGRNIDLSISEISNYFDVKGFSLVKNGMIVKLDKEISKDTINKLGGTIAIGEILASGNMNEIRKELDKKEIYFGTKKNFSYAIWDFSDNDSYDEISEYLKERFKREKLKSTKRNLSGVLNMQSGNRIMIPNSATEEEYFIFSKERKHFFGRIIEEADYKEIEERDMNKPVRREKLAISPRLAKIMINLSRIKAGETLVDPFCGIGVILQEALLAKVKVIGIDRDKEAIEGAKQNLNWGKFDKNNFKLINGNSAEVEISNGEVIVTEPELGETLTNSPTENKARQILKDYEDLMIKVINNLKNKISGRIVFTAPYLLVGKKRIGCEINHILSRTKLRLTEGFPIEEFRDNQIVGRQIFILE